MRWFLLAGVVGCVSGDPAVVNGTVTDTAQLPGGAGFMLRIPRTATVEAAADGPIIITMDKTLAFHGDPPHAMSIDAGRHLMGVATQSGSLLVTLATYGEWTTKDGGASIALRLQVPPGVTVEPADQLSGPNSLAQGDPADGTTAPGTYWYGPIRPAGGWFALP
jgi:hypothetical protein